MKTFLAVIGLFHLSLWLMGCIGLIDYSVRVGKVGTINKAETIAPGGSDE